MTARPIPPAAPVTSATLPCELAGRRRQRELVQLERPVLDREALGRVSETNSEIALAPAITSIARR